MKRFRVKTEFLPAWGGWLDADMIVTMDEVERLASEWEKPVDELMNQLTEIEGDDPVVLFEGYYDGRPVTITLEDGRVMIANHATGWQLPWNSEFYTEDDIPVIKLSLLNEGYRI